MNENVAFAHCLFDQPLNFVSGQLENRLNKYIRHYEGLSYDTEALHSHHQRVKRALPHEDRTLQLDFHAHGQSVKPHTHSLFLSSNLKSYCAACVD